jgi:acid phosphatase type 7
MKGWGFLLLSLHVFSCLVSGVASGRTSPYVRTEFPSTDIPLESEWFAIPKGYNAPQQVNSFVTRLQLIVSVIIVYSA